MIIIKIPLNAKPIKAESTHTISIILICALDPYNPEFLIRALVPVSRILIQNIICMHYDEFASNRFM